MVPIWMQLILVVGTTLQLSETIRHGSLFESFRAWLESRGMFWAELINCGFCFSHWSGAAAVILLVGHYFVSSCGIAVDPFLLTMLWLTGIRGANIVNDVTHRWSRSPSRDTIQIDEISFYDREESSSATAEAGPATGPGDQPTP